MAVSILFNVYEIPTEREFNLEIEMLQTEQISVKFDETVFSLNKNSTVFDAIKAANKTKFVAAKLDGVMVDLCTALPQDCKLQLFTFDSEEGKEASWHSSSHILGNALVNLYKCKLVNGPATSEGFYYDVESNTPISTDDVDAIEDEMRKIIKSNFKFEKVVKTKEQLLEIYKDNPCKTYFIEKNVKNETSVYMNKDFYDMCLGPHLPSTGGVGAVKLLKTSSVYFLNDAKNASLQRIYGISFPNKTLLKEYCGRIKRDKEMDHRKIGNEMDLFFFHKYSPGSCFWLPEGAHIYNKVIEFLRGEYGKRGFSEVITPNIRSKEIKLSEITLEDLSGNEPRLIDVEVPFDQLKKLIKASDE